MKFAIKFFSLVAIFAALNAFTQTIDTPSTSKEIKDSVKVYKEWTIAHQINVRSRIRMYDKIVISKLDSMRIVDSLCRIIYTKNK